MLAGGCSQRSGWLSIDLAHVPVVAVQTRTACLYAQIWDYLMRHDRAMCNYSIFMLEPHEPPARTLRTVRVCERLVIDLASQSGSKTVEPD